MMKTISLLVLFIASCLHGCPTCVGKITQDSPPFFSNDFYKPDQYDPIEEAQEEENQDLMEDMEE